VSYFWKRRSGCDFWVDHVEYREPNCTSLLYALPCESCGLPLKVTEGGILESRE
jgi:hypothetical protein